ATGATELVSACPFCYQGLQVGIQAMNAPIKMRDITELVCMALGVETQGEGGKDGEKETEGE
ncbi:MAG: (Fe-S)-binding protein, partial [Pseudomonadota bacterium]